MSTFFHTDNSPLLSQNQFVYNPNNPTDPYSIYKQQLVNQYMTQNPSVPTNIHDFISELDVLTKGLDRETMERVSENERYIELNSKVQAFIQEEIMNIVKDKINSNPTVTESIKEEIDLINKIKNEVKQEERNNYYEMQDYLKNYSHLTFDDYKKLKSTKKEKITEEHNNENR